MTSALQTPIEQYLAQGRTLSAVEEFAQWHESGETAANRYAALLPASSPAEGEQYAFEVDLDACSGCKACVTACHSLNGLDEDETWREVGLLHGGSSDRPVLQHVTSACHHCLDPACLHACPVDAYEKDSRTGIVKHFPDQCIGCQYCILACPYDVPQYNRTRGVVRKCDMCSDRLSAGEAPACVQACPHRAISIGTVETQTVRHDAEANRFLPGAPEPQWTLPTTLYTANRPLPRNMLPADYHEVRPEHAHWSLVFMLVLTQLSVGAFLVEQVLTHAVGSGLGTVQTAGGLVFGLLALGTSVAHLGRPRYAFRAIGGLKHSWLSREILVFGIFAALALVYAGVSFRADAFHNALTQADASGVGTDGGAVGWGRGVSSGWRNGLAVAVVVTGLAGVFCSVMIYCFTKRPFWNGPATAARFLLTTLILGTATAWLTLMLLTLFSGSPAARRIVTESGRGLSVCLMATTLGKLLLEAAVFRHLGDKRHTPMKRSATLMAGTLSDATLARFGCGLLGGVWMPGLLLARLPLVPGDAAGHVFLLLVVAVLFVACLAGELLERYLFFAAVVSWKMPGTL